MPRRSFSLYDAKARFSEIIRMVREGASVTVTVHGEPVAEIRPIEKGAGNLAQRLSQLVEAGVVVPAKGSFKPQVRARRPGALKRFLADRE
jgi:prevent-host-death family protein